jgi:DedD protein
MRDVERLREKLEISLEDRQVWALGISALLLLAGVFVLGVLIGRRTAPPAQQGSGELAAMDAAPPAVAAPVKVVAEREKESPKQAERAVEATPEPEAVAEKPAQGRAASHAAPVIIPAPHPATVVPAPQRPVTVASVAPVVLTPPPRDLGEFTVQIGASQDRGDAQRLENKARGAGLKPYVVEVDLGAKGTWYRVRVGSFHDKDSAARYRKDVERELRGTAVVMPTK